MAFAASIALPPPNPMTKTSFLLSRNAHAISDGIERGFTRNREHRSLHACLIKQFCHAAGAGCVSSRYQQAILARADLVRVLNKPRQPGQAPGAKYDLRRRLKVKARHSSTEPRSQSDGLL